MTAVALLVLVGLRIAAAQGPSDAQDEVQRFNTAMQDVYHRGQNRLLATTRPLVVIDSDNVTLIETDRTAIFPYIPTVYTDLKAVSHLLIAVIGAVTPWPDSAQERSRMLQDFRAIGASIDRLEARLTDLDLSPEQAQRQQALLRRAEDLFDQAFAAGSVTRESVSAFLNDTRGAWLRNIDDAERAKLIGLNAVFERLRVRLSQDDLDRMIVVVEGTSVQKANNVVLQYLIRAFQDAHQSGRILWAENISDTDGAVAHIGDILMQEQVGQWAFGYPDRMREDLLGFAAGTILDEILPGAPPDAR